MNFDSATAIEEDTRTATSHRSDPDLESDGELPIPDLDQALEQLERELIIRALARMGGNQAKAAKALGITDRIMGLRVRKYMIDPRQFRPGSDDNGRWI